MKCILLSSSGTLPHVSANKQSLRGRKRPNSLFNNFNNYTFSQASRSVLRCLRREKREKPLLTEKNLINKDTPSQINATELVAGGIVTQEMTEGEREEKGEEKGNKN